VGIPEAGAATRAARCPGVGSLRVRGWGVKWGVMKAGEGLPGRSETPNNRAFYQAPCALV